MNEKNFLKVGEQAIETVMFSAPVQEERINCYATHMKRRRERMSNGESRDKTD